MTTPPSSTQPSPASPIEICAYCHDPIAFNWSRLCLRHLEYETGRTWGGDWRSRCKIGQACGHGGFYIVHNDKGPGLRTRLLRSGVWHADDMDIYWPAESAARAALASCTSPPPDAQTATPDPQPKPVYEPLAPVAFAHGELAGEANALAATTVQATPPVQDQPKPVDGPDWATGCRIECADCGHDQNDNHELRGVHCHKCGGKIQLERAINVENANSQNVGGSERQGPSQDVGSGAGRQQVQRHPPDAQGGEGLLDERGARNGEGADGDWADKEARVIVQRYYSRALLDVGGATLSTDLAQALRQARGGERRGEKVDSSVGTTLRELAEEIHVLGVCIAWAGGNISRGKAVQLSKLDHLSLLQRIESTLHSLGCTEEPEFPSLSGSGHVVMTGQRPSNPPPDPASGSTSQDSKSPLASPATKSPASTGEPSPIPQTRTKTPFACGTCQRPGECLRANVCLNPTPLEKPQTRPEGEIDSRGPFRVSPEQRKLIDELDIAINTGRPGQERDALIQATSRIESLYYHINSLRKDITTWMQRHDSACHESERLRDQLAAATAVLRLSAGHTQDSPSQPAPSTETKA